MLWHGGDVASAVSEVTRSGSTFIVFIHGEDGDSAKMNTVWESPAVARAIEGKTVVALKLAQNSSGCIQFGQIYPVVCIPSTFFIGDDGIPLEVIPGYCAEEDLAQKIQHAFQLHSDQRKAAASQHPPASSSQVEQASGTSAAASAVAATNELPATVEQQDSAGGAKAGGSEEDINERLRRAQELIQRKQEERLQQQLEERRQKEAERRQLGKEMARLKQMQAEQNMREGAAELRKDKEDEKIARQKVKEQIAKDRAERAERFQKEKDERRQQAEQLAQEQLAAQERDRERQAAARSNIARIQFRLPDGSTVNNQFEPSDTLETARQYLELHSPSPLGRDFRLSTSYPRRIFAAADMQSTLADLALAPSAVLVVLPPLTRGTASPSQTSSGTVQRVLDGTWSLVQLILAPLLALWNFVYSFIFGAATPPAATSAGQRRRVPGHVDPGQSSATTDQQRRIPGQRPTVRDGNIARLSTFEDPDDPNATWNGNSTQQK